MRIQGDVPRDAEREFRAALEKWERQINIGALLGRLMQWWSHLDEKQQMDVYMGRKIVLSPAAQTEIERYETLYGGAAAAAGILALSRLPAAEREHHVQEATGTHPVRDKKDAWMDTLHALIREEREGLSSDTETARLLLEGVRSAGLQPGATRAADRSKMNSPEKP